MNEKTATHKNWHQLNEIFNQVIELPADERLPALTKLCRDDKSLLNEIIELLAIEAVAGEVLHNPVDLKNIARLPALLVGKHFGNYKITREMAHGGMSTVFEAVQMVGEFERRVAVKLINPLFVTDEIIERFKKEQQILARLEHPHIVKLLDAGVSGDKIPYCVMEYIEGYPITKYCRLYELSFRQKLKLFLQVCETVAYAHRQLIVHRDLKPSNILVTGEGDVKLLDFGIAKVLSDYPEPQTRTQNTLLTPAYASPEQIKNEVITTASDVFSLGTILCELLTEKSPYEFYNARRIDILRAICDLDPIRPSELTTRGNEQTGKTNRANLTDEKEFLKGDPEKIILKALRKDPGERYSSVENLANDIKFYLNGLPVKAAEQSFRYRAVKFIRRNRWSTGAATAALLLILSGALIAVRQSIIARQERQIAERERQIAEERFAQGRKIAGSVILDYHDEVAQLQGSVKLRERMISDTLNYLNAVASGETDNPELLKELATAYRKVGDAQGESYAANLGRHDEALKNYRQSVALFEKAVALSPMDISAKDELVRSELALAYALMRNGDKPRAFEILQKAESLQNSIVELDAANLARRLQLIELRIGLGDSVPDENIYASLKFYRDALGAGEALVALDPDNAEVNSLLAKLTSRVGTACRWAGEREEERGDRTSAREHYRQAVETAFRTIYYDDRSVKLTGKINERGATNAHISLASNLLHTAQLVKALQHLKIASILIQKIKTRDPENREILLDELNIYNVKRKALTLKGKQASALEVLKEALKNAENYSRADPSNTEILSWVGYFSSEAEKLLIEEGKIDDSLVYKKIYEEYARKYRDQVGADWSGKFGF